VVIGICLLIVGCSNKPAPSASVPGRSAHTGKLAQIEYINPLPSSVGWSRDGQCIRQEAATHGISVRTVGPAGGNVNISALENLLSQAVADRVPAIAMWSAVDAPAFDALFAKARAEGAVVASLRSYGATRNQNFGVSTVPADAARALVDTVALRSGHQYLGMILQTPTSSAYDDRFAAIVKQDAARRGNVTVVAVQHDLGKFTDDLSLAEAMMTAHPEINALFAYNGSGGMPAAIVETHRIGRVFGYWQPGDSPQQAIAYARRGVVGGLGWTDHCVEGRLVVQKLLDAWAGKPVLPNYALRYRFVSGDEYKHLVAEGRF
jgi:ABC-type sugar transport system substrate-binding protein